MIRMTVTIIDDSIKDKAAELAKKEKMRGGLSAYVESLMVKDLKERGIIK